MPTGVYPRNRRATDDQIKRNTAARQSRYYKKKSGVGGYLEGRNTYMRKFWGTNPEKALWYSAKGRANRAGIVFLISLSDILIPDVCPILGIPLARGSGKVHDNSPSLDRVIPELGYVPGNIGVISYQANRYKSNMTIEQIRKLYQYVSEAR